MINPFARNFVLSCNLNHHFIDQLSRICRLVQIFRLYSFLTRISSFKDFAPQLASNYETNQ